MTKQKQKEKKNTTHKHIKTNLQMEKDLKLLTLNVQGLRNVKKRKTLFRLIREDKTSFAALLETYPANDDINILQKEWPETIHLSAGTRRSKSLITMFDKTKKKKGKKLNILKVRRDILCQRLK